MVRRARVTLGRAMPKFNFATSNFKVPAIGRDLESQASRIMANAAPMVRLKNQAALSAQIAQISKVGAVAEAQTKLVGKAFEVDFGVGKNAALLARQFSARHTHLWSWLENNGRRLRLAFFPLNLRVIDGIEDIGIARVRAIVVEEGLPLYMVPGPQTAALMLRAESETARRAILADRCDEVVGDCREAVEAVEAVDLAGDRRMVLRAIAAFVDGHHENAQALAGSIIESLVWDHFGRDDKSRKRYIRGDEFPEAYKELGAHEFIALAPIWRAFKSFNRSKGDPVPSVFSRHGSAHTISEVQFTKVNAIQGLMLASSLLVIREKTLAVEQAA